jgi:hypothetical protein
MSFELIDVLFGLFGAAFGSLVTYLLTRHEYWARVEKLKAETIKIREEAERLKADSVATQIAKLEVISDELITRSEPVPIFTKGQSRLATSRKSSDLTIDFSNDQTWSGVALVFTPKLDVREFTHVNIGAIATQDFTFRIEYKIKVGDVSNIVVSSSFQSFPATILGTNISIPLRYGGTIDEIVIMFYETSEASHITVESIRLSK